MINFLGTAKFEGAQNIWEKLPRMFHRGYWAVRFALA